LNQTGIARPRTSRMPASVSKWVIEELNFAGVLLRSRPLPEPHPIGCAGRNRTSNTRAHETRQPAKACPRRNETNSKRCAEGRRIERHRSPCAWFSRPPSAQPS